MSSSGTLAAACDLTKWDGETRQCRWCLRPLTNRQGAWCSTRPDGVHCSDLFWRNHTWTLARHWAKERDGWQCVKCGDGKRLEVNHSTPVLGAHGQPGCHHHIDGLETLCHGCHVAETNRQRRDGELSGAPPAPVERSGAQASLF